MMSHLGKMIQIAGLIGGLSVAAAQSMAAEGSGVIRDGQWTIKIRSKHGPERSFNVDKSNFRRNNVIPAVYQQPEAAPAPALPQTEVAPEATKPAPDAVQPAPVPVAPKPDAEKATGPRLTPAPSSDPAVGSPTELVPSLLPPCVINYETAYAAIPFSRTEYEANPTYRHQAAMELMFHTLRPTTLVQNYTPRAFRYPDSYQVPYGRSDTQHINIRNFGGGTNYNGQSPFGYPYGLKGNW